jgi:hypothetical protein
MPDDEWAYRIIAFCLGALFIAVLVVVTRS